jgi:hypothetical protein
MTNREAVQFAKKCGCITCKSSLNNIYSAANLFSKFKRSGRTIDRLFGIEWMKRDVFEFLHGLKKDILNPHRKHNISKLEKGA